MKWRYIFSGLILLSFQACNAVENDSCSYNFDNFLLKNDSISIESNCDTLKLMSYCMKYTSISKETNCLKKNLGEFKNHSEVSYRDNDLNLARFHSRRMDFFILYFIYNNLFLNDNNEYELIYLSNGDDKIVGEYGNKEESKAIKEVVELYKKWLNSIQEIGLENARKKNLDPFSNSDFKWVLKKKEKYELPFK